MTQDKIRHKKIGVRNRGIYKMFLKGYKIKVIANKFNTTERYTREIVKQMRLLTTA